MSQPLYPLGKDPSVLTRQEDGWAPGPVWTLWQRQNILSLPVIEPWSSSLQHSHYADRTTETIFFF